MEIFGKRSQNSEVCYFCQRQIIKFAILFQKQISFVVSFYCFNIDLLGCFALETKVPDDPAMPDIVIFKNVHIFFFFFAKAN